MTNLAPAPANTTRLILLLFARIFPRHFHTHPFLSGQIKSDRIKSNLEIRRHTSVLLSAVLYCVVIVGGKRIDDSLIHFFRSLLFLGDGTTPLVCWENAAAVAGTI